MVEIKKIPGAYNVDGFDLKNGKCGCTSVIKCCHSWSKVKVKDANFVDFQAKTTSPDTKDTFQWGYKIKKDSVVVSVDVEDAEDKVMHSGYLPPSDHEWQEVDSQESNQYAENTHFVGDVSRREIYPYLQKSVHYLLFNPENILSSHQQVSITRVPTIRY